MSDDHKYNFTSDVDRLSSAIEGYKSQTFQAELKIQGIHQHKSEHLVDVSCEKELAIFHYIGKEHKKSIIRLVKFGSTFGFERRKSAVNCLWESDNLMLYLMTQS